MQIMYTNEKWEYANLKPIQKTAKKIFAQHSVSVTVSNNISVYFQIKLRYYLINRLITEMFFVMADSLVCGSINVIF